MKVTTRGLEIRLQQLSKPVLVDTVVSITNENPPTVTPVNITNYALGDIVMIDKTGFDEIDGMYFPISNITDTTFELDCADTSAQPAASTQGVLKVFKPANMAKWCLTSYSYDQPSAETIAFSTFCGTESASGQPQPATYSVAGIVNACEEGHAEMLTALGDGRNRLMMIKKPTTPPAYVFQEVDVGNYSESYELNAAVKFTSGGNIKSGPFPVYCKSCADYVPPPPLTGIRVSGILSASSTEGANPGALTLTINATDEDANPLAWNISESLAWASFSSTSGTGETSVTVTLDPVGAGLAPGAYEGEFTITAAGAENSPYTGTLQLTYYATPVLAVTPVSLDFGQITEGDGLPVAQTLTVTNSASPAAPMSFTAAGPGWLNVSQSGATVALRPNTSVPGTYSDDVTITSASASNSPVTVPVTFDVQEKPATIVLSRSSLAFFSEPDGTPANQTITVTNGGTTPLSFTVSDDAAWLTVTPTSGTDGTELTISCSAQANEGTYNATITVTDPAATNSPQTIAVGHFVSTNPIVDENLNSADVMSLTTSDYGDIANQGFATEQSVNVGETIDFKVHGDCQTIEIFRCGYYGGGVYRKVATILNTPTSQPAAVTIPDTNGATTCAAWTVTASWDVPANAVSGMYIAVVRNAALTAFSNIVFFVREDARPADIVVKVSDSTWGAAYNPFNTMGDAATIESGADLYGVGYLGSITTRSTQVSFDRPLITRNNVVNHPYNYELGLVSFLEEQGYNVKYVTCYDLDINRGIGTPKVLINAGHDEYWSQNMRDRIIALQNAGTHILWMSANDIFWRIRYLNSRVIECFKDTMDGPGGHVGGTPLDPTSWTGTWRDTRWAGRKPESEIHGTLFRMNGIFNYSATITTDPYGQHPLWRGTAVESTNTTLPAHIGFEANSYEPPSQMWVGRAAATLININGSYADDNGQDYGGNGNLDWGIVVSRYEPTQGVNVSFASMDWIWGLSNNQLGQAVENVTTRQATVNLLTDVGVAASTLATGLSEPAPVSLNYYGVGDVALPNVSGSFDYSQDFQGDWASATTYVAGEVVVNRWRTFEALSGHIAAAGTEPGVGASWESVWREVNPVVVPPTPATIGLDKSSLTFSALPDAAPDTQTITISNSGETPLSFTVSDDAAWLTVTPTSGTNGEVLTVSCAAQSVEDTYTGTITITDPNASNSPQTVSVTYTVAVASPGEVFWVGDPTPPSTGNDGMDYTLGMQFYSFTTPGQVTAIRVYRPTGADSGVTLTGSIWSESGTLLGSTTFGDTSAGGWFEAILAGPIAIVPSTYYVVGVSPIREYVYEIAYFDGSPFFTNGENLYVDATGGRLINPPGFPTNSTSTAFFVDVRFVTGAIPTSIVLNKTSLSFSAEPDAAPATQTITVSNPGDTPLAFTVSDDAAWLTVTPTSGTDDTVLTVSCAAQSVEDTYTGTITITDSNATNSPVTVSVQYTVLAAGGAIQNLYPANPTPTEVVTAATDSDSYTFGCAFTADVPGQVIGVKFWRPAGDTGPCSIGLYAESAGFAVGSLLASKTGIDTSAGGWIEAFFDTPVSHTPGVTAFVACFNMGINTGYGVASAFFNTDLVVGNLTAPGLPLNNNTFTTGVSLAPTDGQFNQNGYYVSPIFAAGAVPTSIILDKSSLSFSAEPDAAPSTQTITVSNPGETPLSFTVSDDAVWLTVTPTSGTDDTVLTVSCAAQSVENNYNGTITITDSNAVNSPRTIPVTYTVAPPLQGEVFFDTTPISVSNEPGTNYRMGTLLIPSGTDGLIHGIRAYRPVGVDEGKTITAVLYAGQQVGTDWAELVVKDFPDTSAGGWFTVQFDAPVAVADGALIIPSIRTIEDYGYEAGYFDNAITRGNILAPASAGRFRDELNEKPTTVTPFAYFIDYVFEAQTSVTQVMFNDNWIPSLSSSDPGVNYTMGTLFNVNDRNGNIVGFRIYRPAGADDGVTLTGHLWTSAGVLLGSKQFGDTSAGGWFETLLDTPIPVTAGSAYVVGISPIQEFVYQDNVLLNSVNFGGNLSVNQNYGRFIGTANTFPTEVPAPNGRTYFADVLFEADPL